MLEQVYPNIYRNDVVLPNNPLKMLNCFIVKGKDRNMIVDTGFNRPECQEDFLRGLKELDLDIEKTDLFLTHLHSDHIGLGPLAEGMGARLLAGARESVAIDRMSTEEHWEFFYDVMRYFGLEKYGMTAKDHPGYRFRPARLTECIKLSEGDELPVGDYVFTVVDIPGHTLGHIGLYEKKHKLFFCGDHILGNITPNITFWGFEQDVLAIYLDSLRKVREYDIKLMLPGHRALIHDHRARIDELLTHHDRRLAELLDIIQGKEHAACEAAAKMTWDLSIKNWEDFPSAQKWFSSGEAMSHLEHLYSTGKAARKERDGVYYYKAI